MVLSLYRRLMALSGPFLSLLIYIRGLRGLEETSHRTERYGVATAQRPSGKVLWLHAASVGEMQSVLPLMRALLAQNPGMTCLITTVTVTAARLVRRFANERIVHQYAPFDNPAWVARFLDHWKPDAALWVESELWPITLESIAQRNIPLIMINGRLSERSAKRWTRVKASIGHVLSHYRLCLAQSEGDAQRLKALGAQNVAIAGNMKYSGAPLPFDQAQYDTLKAAIGERPVILFLSTHEGEEAVAAQAYHALAAKHKDLLLIVMPRHATRADDITGDFEKAGVTFAVRSRQQPILPQTNMYLADTMGEPGLFCRLAPIVFVGNSITRSPGGGHNPIEPAQLGCAIVYGPHMWNFTEIDRDLRAAQGAVLVRQEKALFATLDRLLESPENAKKLADSAQAFAAAQNGVLERVLGHLRPHLENAGIKA